MSIHDAQPSDVYADQDGKLWRVVSICGEPTVCVQEIEPNATSETPQRRSGGVSGYMWRGFERVFRPKPKNPPLRDYQSISHHTDLWWET